MDSEIQEFVYILVTGNPIDGFMYFGPYDTHDEAVEIADRDLGAVEWWTAKLWNDVED